MRGPPTLAPAPAPWPRTPLECATQLPLLALPSVAATGTLPGLYQAYQSADPAGNLTPLLLLLLSKRVVLYACALTTVYVAGMRSGNSAPGLGERLERVTAEAVRPAALPESQRQEVKAVTRQLDATPQAAQAAGLPLIFGVLLLSAYAASVLAPPPEQTPSLIDPAELLRAAFSTVQPLSTASVVLFAVNSETQACARALVGEADDASSAPPVPTASSVAAAAAAAACVACAYGLAPLATWPAQNLANACVAITVARVLQFPSLAAVLAALVGLTLYDGVGTLFAASQLLTHAGGKTTRR